MEDSAAKSAVRRLLHGIGYDVIKRGRIEKAELRVKAGNLVCDHAIDLFRLVVQDYLRRQPKPSFVQVGANDGQRDDDLRGYILEHRWAGILVEPQPGPFARLVRNYAGHDGLRFENAAISRKSGTMTMYGFSGTHGQVQLDVFTTFDRASIERTKDAMKIPAPIERFEVPVMTFAELLDKHALGRVDILVIDTEGHDLEILKAVDFQSVDPAIIQFEHVNLTPADRIDAYRLLIDRGYRLGQNLRDTIAYRSGVEAVPPVPVDGGCGAAL